MANQADVWLVFEHHFMNRRDVSYYSSPAETRTERDTREWHVADATKPR